MARGADLKHRRGGRVDDHTGTTSSLALPFIWKATKNKKMRKQADMIKLNRGRKENGGNNRRRWQLQRIEPGSSALEQAERISLLWWNTNQRLDLCLRSPHHHSIFRSFIHIFFLYPPINFAGVIGKPAQPATFTHTHTHRVDVTLCPPPPIRLWCNLPNGLNFFDPMKTLHRRRGAVATHLILLRSMCPLELSLETVEVALTDREMFRAREQISAKFSHPSF